MLWLADQHYLALRLAEEDLNKLCHAHQASQSDARSARTGENRRKSLSTTGHPPTD